MMDPKRLTDPESQSSPTLRALLRAGRSELPDEERIEAMGARLIVLVGPALNGASHGSSVAPGAGAGSAGAAALKVGVAAKIGAVGLVMATGVGGGYAMMTRSHRASPSPLAAMSASAVVPVVSTTVAPTLATGGPSHTPELAPQPSRQAEVPASPGGGVATETEVSLLESAQDALAPDPAAALAFCERDAARFPRGSLVQEREVIAIEALLRLGRVDAARARAARFYRTFPQSAHRARIENLLAPNPTHNP